MTVTLKLSHNEVSTGRCDAGRLACNATRRLDPDMAAFEKEYRKLVTEVRLAKQVFGLYAVLDVVLLVVLTILPIAQVQEVIKGQALVQEVKSLEQIQIRLYLYALISVIVLLDPCLKASKSALALFSAVSAWKDSCPKQADEIDAIMGKY